ncbi:MAG: peptidoglycan-binding domain-containing protein [Defluviicoccus sp.]
MRNAVFVLAVALILVGLVARFTTDQATEPPPAAAKLGYVVLESRSPQQPQATARLEPAAAERGEQTPILPEAAPAVASPPIASAESTPESPAPRQRAKNEVAKARADAAKARADVRTVTLRSEPAEAAANAGAPARRATAAASAPVPPPAAPVAELNPPLKRPLAPAASTTNASPPPPRPSPDVREAQTLLARLGYTAGAADGIVGPRTQSALLSYQAANSLPADGVVSAALLARLRQDDAALKTLPLVPAVAEQDEESGWSALVSGVSYRIDQLFGRELDSVERPEQLRAHCRANRDAWVYDGGRDKLIFCGSTNGSGADHGTPHLLGR